MDNFYLKNLVLCKVTLIEIKTIQRFLSHWEMQWLKAAEWTLSCLENIKELEYSWPENHCYDNWFSKRVFEIFSQFGK